MRQSLETGSYEKTYELFFSAESYPGAESAVLRSGQRALFSSSKRRAGGRGKGRFSSWTNDTDERRLFLPPWSPLAVNRALN